MKPDKSLNDELIKHSNRKKLLLCGHTVKLQLYLCVLFYSLRPTLRR